MYLSVQLAARRLGVSPHTIRRWTASGFLPCTRTAGGHRRMRQEDVDELAHLIGGSNHLAARLARERELETLVSTSIAMSSELELTELLAEIAKHMTSVLDCHLCSISEYDPATRTVRVLADYDNVGHRIPDTMVYTVNEYPVTKRVFENHEIVVINISDPHADPAETAIMRRDGDKSLLILPMVYQGTAIGLLEVLDHLRERRYSRQEMRLATALAGQAAVALHNAKVFAQLRRSDHDVHSLRDAVGAISASLEPLLREPDVAALLQTVATVACQALGAISSVAQFGTQTAGASGLAAGAASGQADAATASGSGRHTGRAHANAAHVVVGSAPCGDGVLSLTVTLPDECTDAHPELLDLIVIAAAIRLKALEEGPGG
jgi:excisionase family DNA binding protein